MPNYRIELGSGEVLNVVGKSMSTPTNKVEIRDGRDDVVLSLETRDVERIEELDATGEVIATHWGAPLQRRRGRQPRDKQPDEIVEE